MARPCQPTAEQNLGEEQERSGWTMSDAVGLNHQSLSVHIMGLDPTTADILKMLVSSVMVNDFFQFTNF